MVFSQKCRLRFTFQQLQVIFQPPPRFILMILFVSSLYLLLHLQEGSKQDKKLHLRCSLLESCGETAYILLVKADFIVILASLIPHQQLGA